MKAFSLWSLLLGLMVGPRALEHSYVRSMGPVLGPYPRLLCLGGISNMGPCFVDGAYDWFIGIAE